MNDWHSTKQNQTALQLVTKWQCFVVIVCKSITAFLSLREESSEQMGFIGAYSAFSVMPHSKHWLNIKWRIFTALTRAHHWSTFCTRWM